MQKEKMRFYNTYNRLESAVSAVTVIFEIEKQTNG